MKKKTYDEKMKKLAEKVGLEFDGSYGESEETRLHADGEFRMTVFAEIMTRGEWDAMEEQMEKAEIDRKHYTVYAWNDISGYDYWKYNDSNYIQITAHIKNVDKVNPAQLERDINRIYNELYHWHNIDEYYGMERCEECGRNPVGAEEETLCVHCADVEKILVKKVLTKKTS